MTKPFVRTFRRILALAAMGVCVTVLVGQDACVLAQSSGELPRLPESRPTILHASVVPSTSSVISRFPPVFIVPVELSDPTATIEYAAFIDYNELTGEGLVGTPVQSVFEASNTSGRTRVLQIAIPEPADLACHVIEVVVALRLKAITDNKNAHTPDEPGGDIVTWFYNPSGNSGGCPSLDAGIDAPAEADADAAEGGPE